MRTATTARTLAAGAAALAAVCGAAGPASADPCLIMIRTATFSPPTAFVPSDAVTYDTELVPAGSLIGVAEVATDHGTTVRIGVNGLQPNRTYGAHVHTKPCGVDPKASGPHYQNSAAPVQPSTDPAYANADNEVWLDFTTDHRGHGTAQAEHMWRFRTGEAQSIVIHEHATATGAGEAGTAGDRLACYSIPLR